MAEKEMTTIRNFERPKEFWISGKSPCDYAQMRFSDIGDTEFHISVNRIEWNGEGEAFFNKQQLSERSLIIERGDVLTFAKVRIIFFDDWIEVTGADEAAEITLLETTGEAGKFTDYPSYKRSPRVIYQMKEDKIEVKAPPQKKEISRGGILQMIIPTLSTAAFTVLMGVVMDRGIYVYMSLGMTLITMIFSVRNFLTQRKTIREENKQREKVYREYLMRVRKRIRAEREKEKEALNYQYPTAAALSDMVLGYSSRLYERTLMDEDFLQINLGYSSGRSGIEVSYAKDELEVDKDELKENARELAREYGRVNYLPLCVDLKKAHLGLVGSKKNIHEQLKIILMQLTFFQSYHELQIILLHHEAYKDEFSYVRWYPHMHIHAINVTGEICTVQARDQIFGSIQQIIKDRKVKQEEEKQEVYFSPHLLFIIDEPALILNHPIMEYLQAKENNLGFSFIYTTGQQENLPENVQTICLLENAQEGRLLLNEGVRVNRTFAVQHVADINLDKTARTLSAIIHEQGMNSQIPESITFFDMYGIEHPEELRVRERWNKNQSHKSLAVPLGVRAKEDYVELNLHEKAHGPHGLVAGTTGSGKSEIVQSYILSLAVNFHPHEVGFLLIDYKGGGMANLFAKMPHLLGTITNLDKAESMRAMTSIKSELARRQLIFGEHNVNHINGYNKLFKLGKVKEPLPHLFLISDEFAELKKEQPEFMSELVSAARIGRSLGIHLILATQKPSGVVDDQIWTNSKFKLCLKVQNEGDSREMLKTPDAANITQAGRAYLQVGNNEIYELFQSAWSGATYQKEQTAEEKEDDRVYLLNELGQGELVNQDLSGPKDSSQIKDTQLDVVVAHLHEVYESEHAVEVKKPWLPSLATMIVSPHTRSVTDSALHRTLDTTLGLGLIDIPEEQEQREYLLDFAKNGHLLYMASSGYGKSLLLGQILLGLAMKNSVANLNMYTIDLGNSALIAYRGLPHVADYMGFDDSEKLNKFRRLITETISERKKLLAKAMAQNFNVYNQSQDEQLKAIVIAVDNYDIVNELDDEMVPFLQKAARDGAGLGIYLAVTMTRENVMRAATQGSFKERIAGFNFSDGENYSFIGRSQVQVPEDKKGRALVKQDKKINLMQLYTPVPCEDEILFNQELKQLIQKVADASTEPEAIGIPILPEVLRAEMLPQYPGYINEAASLPLGIDMDSLEIKYLNLAEEPGLIVGSKGSGKTNAVKTLLRRAGVQPVYIFDNEEGNLRSYADEGERYYANNGSDAEALLDRLEELSAGRKERYEEAKIEDVTLMLKAFCRTLETVFVVIDSVQQLYDMLSDSDRIDVLAEAAKYGVCILVTSDQRLRARGSAFLELLTESKSGLVLGSIRDQSIFDYTGIREDNRRVELGYYHLQGENWKIKLIENS